MATPPKPPKAPTKMSQKPGPRTRQFPENVGRGAGAKGRSMIQEDESFTKDRTRRNGPGTNGGGGAARSRKA